MSRKNYLSIKLIIMVLILLTISFMAFNFSGFGNKDTGTVGGKQSFSNVEKIVVESLSLSLEVYESDVSEVTVIDNSRFTGIKNREPNIITQEGNTVKVKQRKGGFFLSFVSGNIVIEVPKGSIIEYDLSNVSGAINFDASSKEQLNLKTVSGSIKVHEKDGDSLDAKTTSGSIEIRSAFNKVKTKSVSGSISMFAAQKSKDIESTTVSGSIKVQLENVSGYEMDYKSTSGGVKDMYSNNDYSKSGKATQGDGSLEMDLKSVSGSIKLTDWK